MNSALLSRFDLVFILLDRPDEDLDRHLSEHVMSLHAGGGRGMEQRGGVASITAVTATARRNAQVCTTNELLSQHPCSRLYEGSVIKVCFSDMFYPTGRN